MACLKLTVGCFAVIGLVVVVLVLAAVGLVALGVHQMHDLPERARAAAIERAHAPLLAELRRRLADPAQLRTWPERPAALVAVRHIRGAVPDAADPDLLAGAPTSWSSHVLVDGAGVATIDLPGGPKPCLIYRLEQSGGTWWAYLADAGSAPAPAPAGPE